MVCQVGSTPIGLIEARAQGNPTKDQMRLMMQSLLADRFRLITHIEKQTKPVFHLVMAKAGKTGPQLQAHSENESCSTASTPQPPDAAPPASASAPFLVALQEQLGLKLKSTKGPVDVLVIDHVEHPAAD